MSFFLAFCLFVGYAIARLDHMRLLCTALLHAIKNFQAPFTANSKQKVAFQRRSRVIQTKKLYLFLKYVNEVDTPEALNNLLTYVAYLYFIFLASIVWILTIRRNEMKWDPHGPLVAEISSSWSAAKIRTLKFLAAVVGSFRWREKQTARADVIPNKTLALYIRQASWQQSGTECLLCHNLIWTKEKVLYLPCPKWHIFHNDCAKGFVSTQRRCPVCHEMVFGKDGSPLCLHTAKTTSKKQAMAKNTAPEEDEPPEELMEDDTPSKKKKKQKRNKKIKNMNRLRRRGK
ncbi:hypothetical protein EDD36DRAFT_473799 [Exophiala viscosa]|uniref:RING-type domain-containing protein n=1 Tax=Exophiala viscosa TaxID=2486360 RepID=A0AAN6DW78_9EURO|nr:hypothetical protein EDD36DRAFT_473799 [Exophiala viscosa]